MLIVRKYFILQNGKSTALTERSGLCSSEGLGRFNGHVINRLANRQSMRQCRRPKNPWTEFRIAEHGSSDHLTFISLDHFDHV